MYFETQIKAQEKDKRKYERYNKRSFCGNKKYNNAKTAKEGFGALENLIYTGMEEAKKKETKLEEMLRLRQPFGYNQAQGGRK